MSVIYSDMINAQNVKCLDKILRHILTSTGTQATHPEIKILCDGDEDLAVIAARYINAKPFTVKLPGSLYKNDVVVNDKFAAKLFLRQGGFKAEYDKEHPPKSKAEKLNDHFYMIVDNERIMRIEDCPQEVHSFNDTLCKLDLIKEEGSFYTLSKEGLKLSFSGKTVQDYIELKNPFTKNELQESKPQSLPNSESMMDIFISHSNKDVDVTQALVDVIRKALHIRSNKIRCTSLNGYRLSTGAVTDDVLRSEISNSKAFVAVITSNSVDSTYVTFELGARWGSKQPILLLVCDNAGTDLLKPPLKGINAMTATSSEQIHQFVVDLSNQLGEVLEPPYLYTKEVDALRDLILKKKKPSTVKARTVRRS